MCIEINSPAKLNLYLKVLGKLDSGYHELSSLIIPLKFSDKVTLKINNNSENIIDIKARLSSELSSHLDSKSLEFRNFLESKSNLIYVVCKIFFDKIRTSSKNSQINLNQSFHFDIVKNIPPEAGLGGGSSNAACVLKCLNRYFGNFFTEFELTQLAKKIGSDVAAQLFSKAVIAEGRGEIVKVIDFNQESLDFIGELGVLLIKPSFGTSTKKAFSALNLKNRQSVQALKTEKSGIISKIDSVQKIFEIERNSFFNSLSNDFDSEFSYPKEAVVDGKSFPENAIELSQFVEMSIREYQNSIDNHFLISHILAGSGSTRAVIFERGDDLKQFVDLIKPKLSSKFMLVSTVFDT